MKFSLSKTYFIFFGALVFLIAGLISWYFVLAPYLVARAQSLPTVTAITSSSAFVSWSNIDGASGYRLYIASEPDHLGEADHRKNITTLNSSTTAYELSNLAANVDVFLRIEGVDTNNYYDVYFRTKGGQAAEIDSLIPDSGLARTGLQSVHMYAPNILLLVIRDERAQSYSLNNDSLDLGVKELVNYTGATWQSGPWSVVRNNGSELGVSAIYRDSIPVGNFYDEPANNGNSWGGSHNSHLMDVEHYIYIKFSENVGAHDILNISGPESVNFILPYSDKYLETPVVQLNQVGYNPRSTQRYAYISGWMGDGGALSLSNFPSSAKVFTELNDPFQVRSSVTSNIPITTRSNNDSLSGTAVKEIDLSSVPENNSSFYRVHVPGVGVSYRTAVSEKALLKAYYVTARGLFLNRWGRDLDCAYTDWCDRPADHPTVFTAEQEVQGFFDQATPQTGERPLVGGHHDAGDFDIRVFHYVVARQLLRAYELNKDAFSDGQLNIPESGNGIPDFLDEALWSIAAWEQLQEDNGGVRPGVESYRHPWGNYFADADPLPYWTYGIDPIHSLRVSGLFAQASRLVQPFNSAKAETLKTRAIDAYDYAIGTGTVDDIGGPLFYALSELYRVTGDQEYKNYFESLWDENDAYNSGMPLIRQGENWTSAYFLTSGQPILADHVLGYLTSNDGSSSTTSRLNLAKASFSSFASNQISLLNDFYAHRNVKPSAWITDWGKSVGQGEYLMSMYSRLQLGDVTAEERQSYINAMSLAIDYILGGNPLGMSWVTGLGSRSPQNPLHLDSMTFQNLYNFPPMPGIPVYGPATLTNGASYYDYGRNAMYPSLSSRPEYRRYGDIRSFVTTNEFTVWETQSNVAALFATLLGENLSVPSSWKPGFSDHKERLPFDEDFVTASQVGEYAEGENPSGDEVCNENWSCSGWLSCSAGQQVRTCVDLNSCGTTSSRPALVQSCSNGDAGGGGAAGGGAADTPDDDPADEDSESSDKPVKKIIGTLVKSLGSSEVFLISSDTKRYIPSIGVLRANGFDISDITEVSQADLDTYPDGEDLSYPSGTLLKSPVNSAVYLFEDGKRKVFFNAKYFLSNNFSWDNIFEIPLTEINQFVLYENIKYPNGTLVKGDGVDVYIIDNGLRRKIESEGAFYDLGLDWLNLIVISPFELTFYDEGPSINSLSDVSADLLSSLDADGDNIYDYLESIWGTSKTSVDTDGDGYSDYTEIKNGYDPLSR